MKEWPDLRLRVPRKKASRREILRETQMHRTTPEKILHQPEPRGYRMLREGPKPKIGPFLERIADIARERPGASKEAEAYYPAHIRAVSIMQEPRN